MKPRKRTLLMMTWESPNVQRGVLIYAKEHHWQLEIACDTDFELVRHWEGDGIICTVYPDRRHPMTRLLLSKGLPMVGMTQSPASMKMALVLEDNTAVGRLAAEYYLNKGFRNFLFVARRPSWNSDARRAAFRAALAERGLPVESWSFDDWNCPNQLVERMGERLRDLPKPLAVFCAFDNYSYLVLNACLAYQIAVPEAVAILGSGNEELRCDWARVPLSRIRAYTDRQGYEAARLLDRILDGRADRLAKVSVPPEGVTERASTATLAIHDPAVHQALNHIQANLRHPLTVAEIAQHAGISRSTLVRKFRQELNRGIVEEVNRRRLEEAKKMLLVPGAKAHLVGAALGFSSPYYFYRMFRKITGQTTRQYVAHHRNTTPQWVFQPTPTVD
jgi:LacI family transcriptional regulator